MKARFLLLACVAGLNGAVSAKDDASIEGVVQLPPPTVVRALNQRYGTNAEGPLTPSNPPAAVVYLEGNFASNPKPGSAALAQMAQKNMLFAPDLIAVHTGGAVEFPNLDETYHNVFSYSKTKRFDLGRYRKEEKSGSVVFDKPGVVTVHCEIHDRMRGTVLVLDSPYFQKTDSAGRYRIDHLPAGHFTVKAWINEADVRERVVDLNEGARFHLDFPAK
ncbi:MAG TPA: carboxypeptidase regulatory-like domain-containing protein [Chthoniobacterales bacterium]|nr:carboxypeptidase regulatory-like domain-containing protein [Chthoniobacterales bacterium]